MADRNYCLFIKKWYVEEIQNRGNQALYQDWLNKTSAWKRTQRRRAQKVKSYFRKDKGEQFVTISHKTRFRHQ